MLVHGVATPTAGPLARRLRQGASDALRQRCGAACVQRVRGRATLATRASAEGAGVLAKLGRVLKEKAQADIDRIFKVRPGCRRDCALGERQRRALAAITLGDSADCATRFAGHQQDERKAGRDR